MNVHLYIIHNMNILCKLYNNIDTNNNNNANRDITIDMNMRLVIIHIMNM